jgi:hypothetical protein
MRQKQRISGNFRFIDYNSFEEVTPSANDLMMNCLRVCPVYVQCMYSVCTVYV